MKKANPCLLRVIIFSLLIIKPTLNFAQCTGFSAVINSIAISPAQVNSGSKPSISASIKNTSSSTNGYGGAATFAIKVRITYPNNTYVESFVATNISFNANETKTISNPTTYSTTAYGTYTVTYYVYNIPDHVCLFHSLSKTFQVVAAPTISNTSPAVNSTGCTNQNKTFSLQGNDAEGNLKMIEWYKDGVYTGITRMVSGSTATDSWTTSWTTTGAKTVTAIVYDQNILSVGYTWNITISSVPSPPSLSSPADNAIILRNTSTSFSWGSATGATSYDIQFDSESPVTSSSPYSRSWTSGGSHLWKVRANNTCGNGTYSSARTIIVNNPPTINGQTPASPVTVNLNDSKTFSLTAADVDANLKMCEWYYDDGTGYVYTNETDMITGSTQSASHTRTFSTQGTKYLKAIVYDQYNKTADFVWTITVNPTTGNLVVNLKNKNGVLTGTGQKIFRYNSSYSYIDQLLTNSSGSVSWTSIPTGIYNVEAYTTYQQSLWGDCFWGSAQGTVNTTSTTTINLTQNQPVIENITINGSTFTPGSIVHIELQVRNIGTSGTENCQVEIKIDKDIASPWDYDPGIHGPLTITSGQSGYFGYDWTIPTNIAQGTYYLTAKLSTKKSAYVTTDATGWDKSFTILNTAPTISNSLPASPLSVSVGDQVTFSLTGNDAESNLKMCEWYFDDGAGYVYTNETDLISGGSSTSSYVKTFSSTGSKKLKAIVYDILNQTAAYEWFITSNPQTGNTEVTLFDKNNVKVPSGNKIFRYDQAYVYLDTKATDANGKSFWSAIPVGTYYFEGYNTTLQSLWGDLFWGARQSIISKGQTTYTNIVQSEPYIESITVNGATFMPGTTIHVDVAVKNPSTIAKVCQTDIRIDKDKSSAWDYNSGFHGPVTIQAGQTGYFGFDWLVPGNIASGTYYVAGRVQTSFNQGYSNTDATSWNYSLVVENSSISQIQWSGYTWDVKSGSGGPGPNNWLASSNNIWVDAQGNLHMKIKKIGDKWYCSEMMLSQSLGYGEYTFNVSSNPELLDKNVVIGLFTYETDTREIDIEFSRWGFDNNPVGWNVVQPSIAESRNNFPLNLTGDYSTHKFQWSSSEIFFQSYHGHYSNLPSPEYLINQWSYKGTQIPPSGNERLHINFWLNQGNPPSNLQESEVIIKSFTFKNSFAPTVATGDPYNIGTQTVELSGTVNPNGLSTSAWIEYGTSENYGSSTQYQTTSNGRNIVTLSFPLSELQPDRTYHYRIAASNNGGTTYGFDKTFTTKFAPILLNVPYYSQSDAGWCWAASISMLLDFYGYTKKPWEVAADFDKSKDSGLLFFYGLDLNGFKNYLETYFGNGSGNAWTKETFWNNENLKQKIIQILKTKNPVWINGFDISHAFIVTGTSGYLDDDLVYFHDPDHVLVDYFTDEVNASMKWKDLLSKIDNSIISPNGDAIIIYRNSVLSESHGLVTLQVNPGGIIFSNGYGLPSGSARSIILEWDGLEPYKGYRYIKDIFTSNDSWHPTDPILGFQATNADVLEVIPTITNFLNPLNPVNGKITVEIFNSSNNLVKTQTSEIFRMPGDGMPDINEYGSKLTLIPMKELPGGLYSLVVKVLNSQNQIQDQVQMNFRISPTDFADITVKNNSQSHQNIETGSTGTWRFTITNNGSKSDFVKLSSTNGEKQFQFYYLGSQINTTPVLNVNQSIDVELKVQTDGMPAVVNSPLYTSFKSLNDETINRNIDLTYSIGTFTDNSEIRTDELRVYPNPVSKILYLDYYSQEIIKIQVVNLNGKVIIDTYLSNNKLDVSSLPAGIYYLKIKSKIIKFIKF